MPDDAPPITVIRSADVVIAWDDQAKSHVYLSDADVAFQGGALIFAGRGYTGTATETIEQRPDR
jgi:5-methylthioadenosine/S-adenosylhomocysteine deaminase